MAPIRHGDLTLTPPDGWEDHSQIIVTGPPEEGFRPNLVVTWADAEKGETPGQVAAKTLPSLQKSFQKLEVKKEGPLLLGERSGFQREYTFELEGKALGQLQAFLCAGGKVWTLTFTHLAQKLEASKPLAKKLFESVHIETVGGA